MGVIRFDLLNPMNLMNLIGFHKIKVLKPHDPHEILMDFIKFDEDVAYAYGFMEFN